jgi:hypothetical protein
VVSNKGTPAAARGHLAAGNMFRAYAGGGSRTIGRRLPRHSRAPCGYGPSRRRRARPTSRWRTTGAGRGPATSPRPPWRRSAAWRSSPPAAGPAGTPASPAPSSGGGSKGGGGHGSSSGGGSSSASTSTLNALRTLARQVAADALGLKTYKELDKLSSVTLQSYAAGLLKQVQRAHDLKAAPSELVKRVKDENTALQKELRVRDKLAQQRQAIDAKVTAARGAFNAEVGTVQTASMQGFDITQSGQGYAYGISASLQKQLADAKRFQGDLVTARKMHLSGALVRQFSEAGPASMQNLEAIINAGQGYVTGINKDYASLASTAKATGVGEANALGLGKKLDDALAEQAKMARQQTAETPDQPHPRRPPRRPPHARQGHQGRPASRWREAVMTTTVIVAATRAWLTDPLDPGGASVQCGTRRDGPLADVQDGELLVFAGNRSELVTYDTGSVTLPLTFAFLTPAQYAQVLHGAAGRCCCAPSTGCATTAGI